MDRQLASGAYGGPKPQGLRGSFTVSSWLSCVETPGGAWALVLAKALLTPKNEYDWTQEWILDGDVALAHVNATGATTLRAIQTEAGPASANDAFMNAKLFPGVPNCCDWVFGGLEPLELFDFDGDGEPEVHVGASYGHEGVHDRSDTLLTFRSGRIEPYGPASAYPFEAMRDYTGDNVPDLLMSQPLSGGESCGSGFPADGQGLGFIAHALPGGAFSNQDAAARAFARQSCPRLPVTLSGLKDVLCARLWGADEVTLDLRVRARFAPWDCEAQIEGRPQKPNASTEYQLMLSAAKSLVPFTLP